VLIRSLLSALTVLVSGSMPVMAQTQVTSGAMTPSQNKTDGDCQTIVKGHNWKPLENEIWSRVCEGEAYYGPDSLHAYEGDSEKWNSSMISGAFLQDVLKVDDRSKPAGIHIERVKVMSDVEAENVETDHIIEMRGCFFAGPVDLAGLTSKKNVNLDGSWFDKRLDINGSEIKGDLIMGHKATFHEVDLSSVIVHGNVDFGTTARTSHSGP
jgi:hypothetical protein